MSLPFIDLKAQYNRLKPEIDARIQGVLGHGQFILGPEVAELERALSEFSGAAHVVGVSSGTDALLIALMGEGIGPGDAVFLPAFTFSATAEVIALLGATPVFVDVEEKTFNIDPIDLDAKIKSVAKGGQLKPRAIIAVDLYGLPADYPTLNGLAGDHGLFLLADAAQSFGGAMGKMKVGALAPVTATSFFPAKPLGCYGDGGALFTDDADRARQYRSILAHGKGAAKYDVVRIGINGRLDTLQAAILLPKLAIFAEELKARGKISTLYDAALKDAALALPPRVDGFQSAWAQYTIRLENRDAISARLKEQGIPSAVYYPLPMHLQPAYEKYGDGPGSLPVSEKLCGEVLSLPMHPYMDAAIVEKICQTLISALAD